MHAVQLARKKKKFQGGLHLSKQRQGVIILLEQLRSCCVAVVTNGVDSLAIAIRNRNFWVYK